MTVLNLNKVCQIQFAKAGQASTVEPPDETNEMEEVTYQPQPPVAPRVEVPRFEIRKQKRHRSLPRTLAVSSCRIKGTNTPWVSVATCKRAAELIDSGCRAVRYVRKRSKTLILSRPNTPKGSEDQFTTGRQNVMYEAIKGSRTLTHLRFRGHEALGLSASQKNSSGDFEGFVDAISWSAHHRNLKYLDLSNCSLDFQGACLLSDKVLDHQEYITTSIQNPTSHTHLTHSAIRHLDLSCNAIGTQGGTAIASVLKKNPNHTLQHLNLHSNKIGTEACVDFAEVLKSNRGIQDLNLSHNGLSVEGGRAFVMALDVCRKACNHTLQILNLDGNGLEAELEWPQVIKAIRRAMSWTTARCNQAKRTISQSWVVASTFHQVVDLIAAGNVAVEFDPDAELALERRRVSFESDAESHKRKPAAQEEDVFDTVSEALLRSNKTTHLDLSGCDPLVAPQCSSSLASILKSNCPLLHLDISRCPVGVDAIIQMSEALKGNRTLQHLHLRSISLGAQGSCAIGVALQSNRSLMHLDLSNNQVGVEGGMAIAKGLECNGTLRHLNLSYNKLGSQGSHAVCRTLRKDVVVLEHLDLSHNCIGPGGGFAIAKALEASGNYSLKAILLFGNGLKQPEIKAVGDSLRLRSEVRKEPDKSHRPVLKPDVVFAPSPSSPNQCDCSRAYPSHRSFVDKETLASFEAVVEAAIQEQNQGALESSWTPTLSSKLRPLAWKSVKLDNMLRANGWNGTQFQMRPNLNGLLSEAKKLTQTPTFAAPPKRKSIASGKFPQKLKDEGVNYFPVSLM